MRAAWPSVTRLSQPGNDHRALGVLRRNCTHDRKVTMIRALTILAVVAAFALPAAPASAELLSSPLGTAAQSSHVLDTGQFEHEWIRSQGSFNGGPTHDALSPVVKIWNPGDDTDF